MNIKTWIIYSKFIYMQTQGSENVFSGVLHQIEFFRMKTCRQCFNKIKLWFCGLGDHPDWRHNIGLCNFCINQSFLWYSPRSPWSETKNLKIPSHRKYLSTRCSLNPDKQSSFFWLKLLLWLIMSSALSVTFSLARDFPRALSLSLGGIYK